MAGGMILTGNHPKAMWPGVYAWWGRTYKEYIPLYPKMFDVETPTETLNYVEGVELTGFGFVPVRPQGTPTFFDTETQGIVTRGTYVTWALGYVVSFEELMDNLYEVVSKRRSQGLAFSGRSTKETVCANVYNNAFSTDYTGGDGQPLISASHPSLSGNQSNLLSPDADLSDSALEDIVIMIRTAKNSKGHIISLQPKSLHYASANIFNVTRTLESILIPGVVNNDVNALKFLGSIPIGYDNPYFTDTDAYFVRTDCPEGLKHLVRMAPNFTQDNEFTTDSARAKQVERYIDTWFDWRTLYGSPGA